MSPVRNFSPSQLVAASQEALTTGHSLLEDYVEQERSGLDFFPLQRPEGSLIEMRGFFGWRPGAPKQSVMGCYQVARFTPRSAGCPSKSLAEIPIEYPARCNWPRQDRTRGGFTYTPILLKRLGADPEPARGGGGDFSLPELEWLIVRVDIHDFVRAIPPVRPLASRLSRRIREAALLLVHRDFAASGLSWPRGAVAGCSFGYSFLPLAPEPNYFGFGPGHFDAAFKRFRFFAMDGGSLEIELTFVVSPRSEKVLDLRGRDPVYGLARLLDRLTSGRLGVDRRIHDLFDRAMLSIHGRVHQDLLTGMRDYWEGAVWTGPSAG